MKRFVGIFVAALVIVDGAQASDLDAWTYTKAPPMADALYNWTGFYLGVNGGYAWGQTDWTFSAVGTSANHSTSGGIAGGQIGYNWQLPSSWVVGAEADGDWAQIKGATPCPNPAFTCSSNVSDLASFRGRVGYATGALLLYGTAGLSYANTADSGLLNGTGATGSRLYSGYYDADRWGYTVGAGVEMAFAASWSAKVEYMHYGFNSVSAPAGTLAPNSPSVLGLNIDTLKAGVNYHFGWGG